MGDIQLSDMKSTYLPPANQPVFMGASPPVKTGSGFSQNTENTTNFLNYRNENLAKAQV